MGRYPISLASTAIAKKPLFGIAIAKGSVNGTLDKLILGTDSKIENKIFTTRLMLSHLCLLLYIIGGYAS